MNVLYAADDNYVGILAVSLQTLCAQHEDLNIYILESDISEKHRELLVQTAAGNAVIFCRVNDLIDMIDGCVNIDRGSVFQYARIFLGRALPAGCDRVIYLDSDTMIQGSLKELYDCDLHGNVAGVVEDAFSGLYKKSVGLHKKQVLFNSGLMLIDVELWRREKIENRLLACIRELKGSIPQGDQGLLNRVLRGRVARIPLQYNMTTYLYDFSLKEMKLYRKPATYYSDDEVETALREPVIVHFTTSFASLRPWQTNECGHPCAKEWQRHYRSLGFSVRQMDKKTGMRLLEYMPRSFVLGAVGIVHAYIKPLLYLMIRACTVGFT